MTRQETLKVLAILKAAYPQYYRGLNATDAAAVADLWAVQFMDDSYKDTMIAVHSLISSRTDTFPPVIGEIKQALRDVSRPDDITPPDAWDMVMTCVKSGTYHAAENWAVLPDVVKKSISPEQIKRMAMDEDFNEAVEKSLFIRGYATVLNRERAAEVIPDSLRKEIEARKAALAAQPQELPPLLIDPVIEETPQPQKIERINFKEYLKQQRGEM